jgi:hypothetical protein
MFKGTLTRRFAGEIKSDNPLRTDSISGEFLLLPTVGNCFSIVGAALDTKVGDSRLVLTSNVVSTYFKDNTVTFTTSSGSQYLLAYESI